MTRFTIVGSLALLGIAVACTPAAAPQEPAASALGESSAAPQEPAASAYDETSTPSRTGCGSCPQGQACVCDDKLGDGVCWCQ